MATKTDTLQSSWDGDDFLNAAPESFHVIPPVKDLQNKKNKNRSLLSEQRKLAKFDNFKTRSLLSEQRKLAKFNNFR